MASYVYFKFKSQKEPQRVTIDGPHTDVWNLKREIISISRLGDGTDFDLKIYKENSNEEYTDDTEIIPKDSTVHARRLPASAPGKGRAARYVSGKPPVSAKATAAASNIGKSVMVDMDKMTEQQRLEAMMKLQEAQWQQTQENMAHETRVPMQGGRPVKKANVPEGEPPQSYLCYRCHKKGHWIQECPTNDDPSMDGKNRIKRTTGIPRSMLKKVDEADIDKMDDSVRQHVMVDAEGDFVLPQADEKAWKRHLEQVEASKQAAQRVQAGDKELQDRGLECPIDKRLFVDPMKTPCCGKTYCHDCIENALLDNDLTCPGCQTENVSLEGLVPDEQVKQKMREYQDEKTNEKQQARSPTINGDSKAVSRDGSKSPASATGTSKKRSAVDVNDSNSLAAPIMKRQKSNEGSAVATPQPDSNDKPTTPAADDAEDKVTENISTGLAGAMPNFDPSFMPPDFSQMQNPMAMNPLMMNNPMMQQMMLMAMMNNPSNMQGMNPMAGTNSMNGTNGMNGMQANQNYVNNNYHQNQGYNRGGYQPRGRGSRGRGAWRAGYHNNYQYNNQQNLQQEPQQPSQNQEPKQPEGLANVPKGPKAMLNNNATPAAQQGFHPPTGPSGGKFSNQQRYNGKEEDNAYMRQPVNPGRQWGRNRGQGRMREAEYRELGPQG